jgi:hypothetical protein
MILNKWNKYASEDSTGLERIGQGFFKSHSTCFDILLTDVTQLSFVNDKLWRCPNFFHHKENKVVYTIIKTQRFTKIER